MNIVETLAAELAEDNLAYRSGNPRIADDEYDQKVEKLRSLDPEHPFLNSVEPEPEDVFSDNTVRHTTPMLSTKKAYAKMEISTFINTILEAAVDLGIPMKDVQFKVTPKLDGMSGRYDGDKQLLTRGNGVEGQDISSAFAKGVVIEGPGGYPTNGELVVDEQFFQENLYGKIYEGRKLRHPRNFVAGLISADIPGEHHLLAIQSKMVRFVPYDQIDLFVVNSEQLLKNLDTMFDQLSEDCRYRTDGIVIEALDERIKTHLGATDSYHRWQIAFKRKGATADVVIKDMLWQVGRTGVVTPVICIDPVDLSDAIIQRISAHNASEIREKGLGIGAKIRIKRAGEVIPALDCVLERSEHFNIPDRCPCCNGPLEEGPTFLVCNAGLDCSAQVEGILEHFCKTMEMDGFGPQVVKGIIRKNKDILPSEILQLEASDFMAMGISQGIAKNLAQAIVNRKKKPIDDWRVLAAFGIRNLGRGDSKNLLRHTKIGGLNFISEPFLRAIDGFGPTTSGQIADAIRARIGEINAVVSTLQIIDFMDQPEQAPLQGEKIVFTGTFQAGDRKMLEKTAETLGAKVQSEVNGGTTLLVVGVKPGSKKVSAAAKLGTRKMDEQVYMIWLNGKQSGAL